MKHGIEHGSSGTAGTPARRQTARAALRTLLPLSALLVGLAGCAGAPDPASLLSDAEHYRQKGQFKAAIIQLKNVLQTQPEHIQARTKLGELYIEAGDLPSAEKELRRALALGAAPARILPALGRAMLMQGQADKVLAEIRLDRASPEQMDVVAVRAEAFLALGDTAQAKQLFELIARKQPAFIPALLGLARLAALEQQPARAAALAEQALALRPDDIDSLRLKGDLLRLQGDTDAARLVYLAILTLRPDHVHAHIDLANLYLQAGKFEDARAAIAAARRNAPNNLLVVHAQAMLDFREAKYKSSLESLQQILRVAPEHMPSLLLLGAVQLALGSPQLAEQALQHFLKAHPRHPYASKLLASIALNANQPEAAQALLAPLLEGEVGDVELLSLAGETAMRARRFTEAARYFERATVLAPKQASLRTALGVSRLGSGDHPGAITELEQATVLDGHATRPTIMLVMTHLRDKQDDKAMAAAMALERQQPDNPLVHNLKGGVYLSKQDPKAARASFERALALAPTYVAALDNLAQLDQAERQPERARLRYQSALEKDQSNPQLMAALAKLAMQQGKIADATAWLEKASRDNPQALGPAVLLSNFYLQQGQAPKALALTQQLLTSHPERTDLLALLAEQQSATGNGAGARDTLQKLAQVQPASAELQMRIANTCIVIDDQSCALQAAKKAIHLQPAMLAAKVMAAGVYIKQGKLTEALTMARAVQQAHPTLAAGFKLEGDVRMAESQPKAALAPYQKAFDLNPIGPLAILLHQTLVQAGNPEVAETRMRAWLHAHPNDLPSRLYVGGSKLASRDYPGAVEQYGHILRQQPDNVVVLNDLAWTYQQQRDPRALATAERAYTLAPRNPAVLDTLACIVLDGGDRARALSLLQQATALAPQAAEIRYHLGLALFKSGDQAGARSQLQQALDSKQPFADKPQARALLTELDESARAAKPGNPRLLNKVPSGSAAAKPHA
ncbi:MAG: XrtA/PEP-CTERM system TPR-repeat protein PrsT [Pseudomonadota bacterium]